MSDHGRSLVRAPDIEELQLVLGQPLQVLLVQQLHDAQRIGEDLLPHPRSRVGTAGDVVRRAQRVVELAQVELAQLGQGSLVLTLGIAVLAVLLVHRQPARVQGEVDGPEPHGLAQLGVVALAVLPPRRHGGHQGLRIQVRECVVHVRAGLRTEQRDLAAHAACTVTVRPTSSSMSRRTSKSGCRIRT